MPRAAKLKVFRTAIGFHDAYVAAGSRKAALEGWGSEKDLFACGAAEQVTEEALVAEPLAAPGKVIRRLRGTIEQQLAALPPDQPKARKPEPADHDAPTPGKKAKPKPVTEPKPRPRSRPSRVALDSAEQAILNAETEHAAKLAEIRDRERALADERRRLEAGQQKQLESLEAGRDKARAAYEKALAVWRAAER